MQKQFRKINPNLTNAKNKQTKWWRLYIHRIDGFRTFPSIFNVRATIDRTAFMQWKEVQLSRCVYIYAVTINRIFAVLHVHSSFLIHKYLERKAIVKEREFNLF